MTPDAPLCVEDDSTVCPPSDLPDRTLLLDRTVATPGMQPPLLLAPSGPTPVPSRSDALLLLPPTLPPPAPLRRSPAAACSAAS